MTSPEIQLKSNLNMKQIKLDVPCDYHELFDIHKDGFCHHLPFLLPKVFENIPPCIGWATCCLVASS